MFICIKTLVGELSHICGSRCQLVFWLLEDNIQPLKLYYHKDLSYCELVEMKAG
jgi:hypothetical protein